MSHGARWAVVCLLAVSMAALAQGERNLIDGSTGVTPLVQALAKAYMEQNPSVAIEIGKGLGTKARIQALSEGKIDIAMASHGLDVAAIKRAGMAVREVGKVAVVFGVNASVAVTDLSESQICDVYAGKAQRWKQLGGPDLAIVPLTWPSDRLASREQVLAEVIHGSVHVETTEGGGATFVLDLPLAVSIPSDA